jgi:hypothetical protein
MLGEAVNWLLVLVTVVATRVVVGVFFTNHVTLEVIKEFQGRVEVGEPFVTIDLLDSQTFLGVYFQQTTQKVTSFD